ncbi:MAG: InlB B-repeat-containing protein [Synergistaceae bacterium]|nr:InlB B-repeat-containing protein [Synergistaceae bacterium]
MRKLLTALALILILASFTRQAYADGGDIGNGVHWNFDSATGELTFSYTGSGSGAMPDYSNHSDTPWDKIRHKIEVLTIGSGVTYIGRYCFNVRGNGKWKRVFMSDTVKTIGNGAFLPAYDIGVLKLGKNVEKIGSYAFKNPSALTTLILPPALKEIGNNAFMQAFSLGVITFTVPKEADFHDLDIGKDAFQEMRKGGSGSVKIAYTSEKGILRDRNTKAEIAEGSELSERELSSRALTWVKHTPVNYVITYEPNGGRFRKGITTMRVPVNTTAKLHTQEELGLYNLNSDLMFKGWSTNENAKKAEYKDGAEIFVSDDITLYAVWSDSYNITLDANGGTFANGTSQHEIEIKAKTSANLPLAADLGLKHPEADKICVGWAVSPDAKASYSDGASITPTDDMTLYAVWGGLCTVILDPNGGYFTKAESSDIKFQVLAGGIRAIPAAQTLGLKNDSQDLYYNGWSLDPSSQTAEYPDGLDLTVSEDMKLYAVWTVNGDGSEGSPYLIDSFERLRELAEKTNNGEHYTRKHFKLTAEIWDTENTFTPIGRNYNLSFNGTFDGNSHSISYRIDASPETYQGLFGCLDTGAEIKNLIVCGNIKDCDYYAGSIAGEIRLTALITNCYGSATITAKSGLTDGNIGGLVGLNAGTIDHCASAPLITADVQDACVGGLAGSNQGVIDTCAVVGDLKPETKNKYMGMVTGNNNAYSALSGTIKDTYYCVLDEKSNIKGIGGKRRGTDEDGDKGVTKRIELSEMLAYADSIDTKYNVYKKGVIAQSSPNGDEDEYTEVEVETETSSNNSSSGCNALSLNYLLALALCFIIKFNKKLD